MSRSDFNNDGFDDLAIGVRGETVSGLTRAGAVNVLRGSSSGLTAFGDQYWHQNRPGVREVAEQNDSFGRGLASGDFDNDGFTDLAIGAHFEDIGSGSDAGVVNVLYGSRSGLAATGNQVWHQNVTGIRGTSGDDDHFGEAMATGDFNNDGFDDLLIGVHYEDFTSAPRAGAVAALYGSSGGLTSSGNQLWSQNRSGISDVAERNDAFGSAIAVGDFNNDGFDDMAAGAPGEQVGGDAGAGAVNVIRGSSTGLTAAGDRIWTQDTRGVNGSAEARDGFGSSLGVGDFDNDGFDDLVIGASAESVGRISGAGAINVLHGSSRGLTATDDQVWSLDSRGIRGVVRTDDGFGEVLAAGDFDGDGYDDLAIGAPGKDVGRAESAGAVSVLYGSRSGLSATGNQIWNQDSLGVSNSADSFDFFGSSLSVGDYNDDGFEDLAIGVPGENIGSASRAGATAILYGSDAGLSADGDRLLHQNSSSVLGQAGTDDLFGFALA